MAGSLIGVDAAIVRLDFEIPRADCRIGKILRKRFKARRN